MMIRRGLEKPATNRVFLLLCFGPGHSSEASGFASEPESAGSDPLVQVHVPGAVARTRTLKVWPPSQKPYTRFLKLGPVRSTQTVTSVYALA